MLLNYYQTVSSGQNRAMSPVAHFLASLLGAHRDPLTLHRVGHDTHIATVLETAFDSASRNRGLLGRSRLEAGRALIIAPCSLVHTFRMAFPIDLVFAARDGRVLKLRERVQPNRISGSFGAFAVIEMAAGAIEASGLVVGDVLEVRGAQPGP